MAVTDDGGVKAMDVDSSNKGATKMNAAEARHNQLPWVEKYRPNKYVNVNRMPPIVSRMRQIV